MQLKRTTIWFSAVSMILVFFGVLYAIKGLSILPVPREVLPQWESALYGAIMMRWGTTLFLVVRFAFQRHDPALMKALLYGLTVWLAVEAVLSAYYGVWFNVGVDVAVLALFGVPLLWSIGKTREVPGPSGKETV